MSNKFKWKLLELKSSLLKPFREIKRIVGQFFETEYFYRWKHTIYPWFDDKGVYRPSKTMNVYHLNNTWDGSSAIFGILDDKLFHMYINLRNYSSSPDRYLNGRDINEFGTDEEKVWAFEKIVKANLTDNLEDDPNYHYKKRYNKKYYAKKANLIIYESTEGDDYVGYQITRYLHKSPDCNYDTYRLEKLSKVYTGATHKVLSTYDTYISGEVREIDVPDYKIQESTILDLGSVLSWINVQEYFNENKIKIDVVERTLLNDYGMGSVNVEPNEILMLSDTLKSKLHGRIIGLHKVYSIRKKLGKICDMDITTTKGFKEDFEKLHFIESQTKRDVAFKELHARFIDERQKLASEVMADILDDSDWID